MRKYILALLITLAHYGNAQLNNTMFNQRNVVMEQDSNSLFFKMKLLGFSKNNEYIFGVISDGQTYFGYQLNPSIFYQPTKNVQFDLGVFTQKDFGNDQYTKVLPTFTFTYQHEKSKLIFGTLEGATMHRLIEPMYDFDKVILDRLENGLQFIMDKKVFYFDAWIDWQNMLYRGQKNQEEVTGGISGNYVVMDKNIRLTIPVQWLVKHVGGQIDVSPLPLQTYVNTAVGLSIDFPRDNESWLTQVHLDGYYVNHQDYSFEQLIPFKDGDGLYFNAEIKTKFGLEAMVSYWHGNEFLSIQGGQLYRSESSGLKKAGTIEDIRQLLIFRIFHNMKLADNLVVSSRLEPYFDLQENRFEFSNAFYVNYLVDFFVTKPRRHR